MFFPIKKLKKLIKNPSEKLHGIYKKKAIFRKRSCMQKKQKCTHKCTHTHMYANWFYHCKTGFTTTRMETEGFQKFGDFIERFPVQTPLDARPGLQTQPRYEVPSDLRVKQLKRSD